MTQDVDTIHFLPPCSSYETTEYRTDQISYLTDTNEAREKKMRIQDQSLKEMTIMKDKIIELRELNNDYERKIEDQKCEFDSTMIRIQTALSKQASAFPNSKRIPMMIPACQILSISTKNWHLTAKTECKKRKIKYNNLLLKSMT